MSDENDKVESYAAAIGAGLVTLVFLLAFSLYLFPWIIPCIWELPEGMTPAYYGILLALEMSGLANKWKQAKMDYEEE